MRPRYVARGQPVAPEKLRQAKALRREMTPDEALLWKELRRNRLEGFHFRRQQVIDGFIVDFFCNPAGVVVEVDGGIHTDPEQATYDKERDALLAGRGLTVLRISNEQVQSNLPGVLTLIAAACRGGRRPPTPKS